MAVPGTKHHTDYRDGSADRVDHRRRPVHRTLGLAARPSPRLSLTTSPTVQCTRGTRISQKQVYGGCYFLESHSRRTCRDGPGGVNVTVQRV